MIDIEPLAAGAHRIAIYGEVTGEDIAGLVAFARAEVAKDTRKNILFDIVSFAAVSFTAVREELAHLGVLWRWAFSLDRIAIVSDEAWIRGAARIESALLPGIAYKVFDEAGEAEARAWVMAGDPAA